MLIACQDAALHIWRLTHLEWLMRR